MSKPNVPSSPAGSAIESIRQHYMSLLNDACVKYEKAEKKVEALKYDIESYEAALASIDGRLVPLVQRFGHVEQHELFEVEGDQVTARLSRVS